MALLWQVFAGLAVYVLLAVVCGRVLYSSQRRRLLAANEVRYPAEDAVDHFQQVEEPSTTSASCVGGLLWPVVLPTHLLHRLATRTITSHPPDTPQDHTHDERHLRHAIDRLETETETPLTPPEEDEPSPRPGDELPPYPGRLDGP